MIGTGGTVYLQPAARVIVVQVASVAGIASRARPVVMAAVAIVETAVTAQHVAAIQTIFVVQIQVLIAVDLVKLVATALAVVPDSPVVMAPVAIVATAVTTKYVVIWGTVVVQIPGLVMLIAVLAVRHVVIRHVVTRQLRSVVMT